jgi:hypothetical protein
VRFAPRQTPEGGSLAIIATGRLASTPNQRYINLHKSDDAEFYLNFVLPLDYVAQWSRTDRSVPDGRKPEALLSQ